MFIFQVDLTKPVSSENVDLKNKASDNPESVLLKTLNNTDQAQRSSTTSSKYTSPEMLLGKIMDLATEYISWAKHNQSHGQIIPLVYRPVPWEKSNELFEALAQYTKTPASMERINEVKAFFNGIMNGNPTDPNGDKTQDVNDVFAIWGKENSSDTKGDINDDGKIDETDIRKLSFALGFGDINNNGKLDKEDYKILEERVLAEDRPTKGWFIDLNHDGQINKKDLDILGHILKAGDMDSNGEIDATDLAILRKQITLPPPSLESMVGKYVDSILENKGDFSKTDPEIFSGLINALAEKTGIPIDRQRSSALIKFFDYIAFGSRDFYNPSPPLKVQELKNLKVEDVIEFWRNPRQFFIFH